MKRLITILLSFIGCVSLFGQGVPMVVAGDVYINGTMRSQGAVNVYAATSVDTGKIYIASTAGAALVTDTVILYSNDTSDGLLMNVNTSGVQGIAASNAPTKVVVRKTFTPKVYTYFSLPFAVVQTNVKTELGTYLPGGGTGLTGYWAYQFDSKLTSDSIQMSAWKEINYANGFQAGLGYLVWYDHPSDGSQSVDFITTTYNGNYIDTLFSYNVYDKPVTFPVYSNHTVNYKDPSLGDGWAFLGGRNSTTFTFKNGTIGNYTGSVWYRNSTKSQEIAGTGEFKQVSLAPGAIDTVNLPPYTPFYIQEARDPVNAVSSGTIKFSKSLGLSLQSAQFRSFADADPIKDQLYFLLSSDQDESSDHFYLNFADSYVETYQGIEDALKMTTSYSNSPAMWSIQDKTNTPLFVNGLPMVEGRKVQLGFSVPEAGDYTLSLDPLREQDVKSVILVDNDANGKKIDLLQTPRYSFSTGTVNSNKDRFVLYINSSYTGTPSVSSSDIYAYAKDNILTVKNLSEGDRVQVLDLAGRTIASGKASGKEFSTALSQKGVYIINVVGEKMWVQKILNR